MKQVLKEKQVYCFTMESGHCLFADERDKKHMLDLVGEIRKRNNWDLYAYCIMDNAAYFVIGANQITQAVRELQSAVLNLLRHGIYGQNRRKAGVELSTHTKRLATFVQIADCCREIHRIPLRQGYVKRLEDYWWSSYPVYAGVHRWEPLIPGMLFLYNSDAPSAVWDGGADINV
ncbi:MAG: hypothetical protein LIP10_04335 [Clostridiales bacterium]|nr:hypothetical protein [Clostridiales bacterium]